MIESLRRMEPYELEKLVANLWEKKRYRADVKDETRDRGIDVIAQKQNVKKLIQVKRYNAENKVGSQEVRKYATLYTQDEGADSVIIVTTGEFTQPAVELADELNVDVVDGDELVQELRRYGVNSVVESNRVVTNSSSKTDDAKKTNYSTVNDPISRRHPDFEEERKEYRESKNHDATIENACPNCGGTILWVQGGPGTCSDCENEFKFYELSADLLDIG